jgi:hypothetical protein
MRPLWERPPPFMERTLWYDVKSGCLLLLGVALGVLVFNPDQPWPVAVSAATLVVITAVRQVVRRVMLRREQ